MLSIVEHGPIGTSEGKVVERVTIVSSHSGFSISLINLGATLTSVKLPDLHGDLAEVTLGHDSVEDYLNCTSYFGATIGRVANRIAGGEFFLDGKKYALAKNDRGLHCLHGGRQGFDRVVWDLKELKISREEIRVPFAYISPHMEEGFPGTVRVEVIYKIRECCLEIDYRATTDSPTLLNLTNHTYWNLEGVDGSPQRSCLDHLIQIDADAYLPVDDTLIPTGEITSVAGTALDVRGSKSIRNTISAFGDIDRCLVLRGTGLRNVAELYAPRTGRVVTMTTDQSGLQWYTGNYLEGVPYRAGTAQKHQAVCLEAQGFPDAIHKTLFPSVRLDPGKIYRQTTVYSFGCR